MITDFTVVLIDWVIQEHSSVLYVMNELKNQYERKYQHNQPYLNPILCDILINALIILRIHIHI
jgi:hypothetical protein